MPSLVGWMVFTEQSVHFACTHLNELVSFSSIYSFSRSSGLEELYLSLMGFMVIHHVKEAFQRLEDFDDHVIANAQSIGQKGSTFLNNENSYLMWQPLFYNCLTALFSVIAASVGFISQGVETNSYAGLFYAIIVLCSIWLNIWYFVVFFIMFWKKSWYKLHIMSKIQQSARSEYWNFHMVDINKGQSLFKIYRSLVLTNDSYAETVTGLREEIESKGPFLERIKEEGKLDAKIKLDSHTNSMAADDYKNGVGMIHITADYLTGFVSLYIGLIFFGCISFLAACVASCNISSDGVDIFGTECTATEY